MSRTRAREPAVLHVTSTAAAGRQLAEAGVAGDVLPWRDVLCEGPVPAGLSHDELSTERADFLARRRWAEPELILADIRARDGLIRSAADDHQIVLWFSRNLIDQLQFLQVVDLLDVEFGGRNRAHLVPVPAMSRAGRIRGIGMLKPRAVRRLYERRYPLRDEQIGTARMAWSAFRSNEPRDLSLLAASGSLGCLPHLQPAIDRLLQEFPSAGSGLSALEGGILTQLEGEPRLFRDVLADVTRSEVDLYPGDADLWSRLVDLANGRCPAIELDWDEPACASASITDVGRAVLGGEADLIEINGIDRWIGGVHLLPPDADWRRTGEGRVERRPPGH